MEHAGAGETVSQAEQTHNVDNAGTSLLMVEEKARSWSCGVLASAVRMTDAPRSIKELPLSWFQSLKEGWGIAKPGSEHVVDPLIRS